MISQSQKIKLENAFKSGELNFSEISKQLGIRRGTVREYSKKLGYHKGNKVRLKTHALDLTYFSKIDTVEKAYVLGFLYADGCNTGRGLQLGIDEQDEDVIKFVKSQLGASNSLRFIPKAKPTWCNKWELSIKSMELSKQLTAVGCPPAKSLILEFPHWLDENLISHFIRGFFDGDGSIWNNGKYFSIAFSCGSISFIKELHEILLTQSGANLNYYKHPSSNGNSIQSSKQETVEKVLTYLYNNSSFSMRRKREKALAFFAGRGGN